MTETPPSTNRQGQVPGHWLTAVFDPLSRFLRVLSRVRGIIRYLTRALGFVDGPLLRFVFSRAAPIRSSPPTALRVVCHSCRPISLQHRCICFVQTFILFFVFSPAMAFVSPVSPARSPCGRIGTDETPAHRRGLRLLVLLLLHHPNHHLRRLVHNPLALGPRQLPLQKQPPLPNIPRRFVGTPQRRGPCWAHTSLH